MKYTPEDVKILKLDEAGNRISGTIDEL